MLTHTARLRIILPPHISSSYREDDENKETAPPSEMGAIEPSALGSSRFAQPSHVAVAGDNNFSGSQKLSSSILDELQHNGSDTDPTDDASVVTYSYNSTWSSNYTMSNLPGTGRLIGSLYLKVGLALERRLWRLLNLAALKAQAEILEEMRRAEVEVMDMIRDGIWGMIKSKDENGNGNACEVLLLCARYVLLSSFHCVPLMVHLITLRKDRMTSTSKQRHLRELSGFPSGSRQNSAPPLRKSFRDATTSAKHLRPRGSVCETSTRSESMDKTSRYKRSCRCRDLQKNTVEGSGVRCSPATRKCFFKSQEV